MQPILTAAQMREVDRLTTERYGIPSLQLMENAAQAVADVITEKLGGSVAGRSFLILCGKGNNGGDGAALARKLAAAGATVEVVLFGRVADTKGDARVNFDKAVGTVANLQEISSPEEFDAWLTASNANWDVMVDSMFGTGLNRPLEPWLAGVIRQLNTMNAGRLAVSVDVPSGLNADLAQPIGETFRADLTVTFTAPKLANAAAPASSFGGELVVAQIGSPTELVREFDTKNYLAEPCSASDWLAETAFSHSSYKNRRGHSLVIAGSEEFSGAAVLAANSAMRSGVGLVTVVTPRSSKDSVAARVLPEVMVRGVSETDSGAIAEAAIDELGDLLEKADSIAIGCGLSQSEDTKRFVEKIVGSRRQPLVLDADALNLLSPFSMDTSNGPALILTPHEGEFRRLSGKTTADLDADRVGVVREFAVKHNVILVLKGERVLIGSPDGKVVVNPTGNSGLGKAGNGDTLTGIIGGFLAQATAMNVDVFKTVVAAALIAGMAGDFAEKRFGKRVMTASDVRECLTEVFAAFGKK